MSWTKLPGDKRVAVEPTSKRELDDLRQMVAAEPSDAHVAGVSAKGKYEFAYNAARPDGDGRRPVPRPHRVTAKTGHHYFMFQALRAVDPSFVPAAICFDDARDNFSYENPAQISDTDAADLLATVERFQHDGEAWITATRPALGK